MTPKIQELANSALGTRKHRPPVWQFYDVELEQFAQLIVEECRTVISEVYRKTPLEFCGPLLAADQALAEHFYGVEQ